MWYLRLCVYITDFRITSFSLLQIKNVLCLKFYIDRCISIKETKIYGNVILEWAFFKISHGYTFQIIKTRNYNNIDIICIPSHLFFCLILHSFIIIIFTPFSNHLVTFTRYKKFYCPHRYKEMAKYEILFSTSSLK